MSHVATIDLRITDLEALAIACEALGLELQLGKTTYAWWNSHVGDYPIPEGMTVADLGKCQHAIKVKGTTPQNGPQGPWEIGLVADGDGFRPVFDFFGSAGARLTDKAGVGLSKLKVEYASAIAIRQLARQGYRVRSTVNAQGQRQIVGVKG